MVTDITFPTLRFTITSLVLNTFACICKTRLVIAFVMAHETVVLKRTHSEEFKKQVLAEVALGKQSLSAIAKKHHLAPPLVFNWRKKGQQECKVAKTKAPLLLEDQSAQQAQTDPLDLELQAMNAIYSALKPLNDGCRKRVMDWVAQRVIYV